MSQTLWSFNFLPKDLFKATNNFNSTINGLTEKTWIVSLKGSRVLFSADFESSPMTPLPIIRSASQLLWLKKATVSPPAPCRAPIVHILLILKGCVQDCEKRHQGVWPFGHPLPRQIRLQGRELTQPSVDFFLFLQCVHNFCFKYIDSTVLVERITGHRLWKTISHWTKATSQFLPAVVVCSNLVKNCKLWIM